MISTTEQCFLHNHKGHASENKFADLEVLHNHKRQSTHIVHNEYIQVLILNLQGNFSERRSNLPDPVHDLESRVRDGASKGGIPRECAVR